MRWSNILVAIMVVVAVGLGMLIANLSSSGQGGDTGSFQLQPSVVVPTASSVPTGAISPTLGSTAATATSAVTAASTATEATATPARTATSAATAAATATPARTAAATATPARTAAATATPARTAAATATAAGPGAGAFIEYTVESGDTLTEIAEAYGVTVEEIIAVNDIPNPDSLTVGSVLRIPRP